MVPLPVHLDKNSVKRRADAAEYLSHTVQMMLPEDRFAVFRQEDQMDMQGKDAVPTVTHLI